MFTRTVKNKYNLWKISSCSYKYTINHQFLDNGIISHSHAWFWGLYLTDGCVQGTKKGGALRRIVWRQRYDSYPILAELLSCAGSTHSILFGVHKKQFPFAGLSLYNRLSTTVQALSKCNPGEKHGVNIVHAIQNFIHL